MDVGPSVCGGVRTVGALDVGEGLGILLYLDHVGAGGVGVGLGQADLLVGHVVGDVGGAQEGVAQQVELVVADAKRRRAPQAKETGAGPAPEARGCVVALEDLLQLVGEAVDGHVGNGDLDCLVVKLEADEDAVALAAFPGAVDHGGRGLALNLDHDDAELVLDGLDEGIGYQRDGGARVQDAD